MKNKAFTVTLGLLIAVLSASTVRAQSSKEAIYDKIESSYAWINAAFLKQSTTLNLTEEQWDYALKNEFVGLESINNVGNNIAAYFEIVANNRLVDACRYGKGNADCEEKVSALAPRLKIEANLQNLKMSPARFKLAMYALNTIGNFLGSNNIYGPRTGWRPKNNTVKIVMTIDNGVGQPIVTWKPDGSVATVKMFVGEEVGDWAANMMKGLEKGGKK